MLNRQKINDFLVDNTNEDDSDSQNVCPFLQNKSGQEKYLQYTLNSINPFLLSLLMLSVGSRHKLLHISWYKNMKPFRTNLKFVIKIFLLLTILIYIYIHIYI